MSSSQQLLLGEGVGSGSSAINYVEDVFSTYLYTGNGSSQTINNGIALANTAGWSVWYQRMYGGGLNSLAVDSSGNVYSIGADSTNNGSSYTGIIYKYSSTGTIIWQRKYNASYTMNVQGGCIDSSGNVYFVGQSYDGSYNFGAVMKFNSSGTIQWSTRIGDKASSANSVATNGSDVYVGGSQNLSDGQGDNQCLTKLNSSGSIQWMRKFRKGNFDVISSVVIAPNGYIYTCGFLSSGYTMSTNAWDSSGNLIWNTELYQGTISDGYAVAVDSSSNCYSAGRINAGTANPYGLLAKYDSGGNLQWQRRLYSGSGQLWAVATDSSNNVYVSGSVDISGISSNVIAKYNSSGTIQWQRSFTNSGVAKALAVDNTTGTLYISLTSATSWYTDIVSLKTDGSTVTGAMYVNGSLLSYADYGATDASGTGSTSNSGSASNYTVASTAFSGSASTPTNTTTVYTSSAPSNYGGMVWIKGRSLATGNFINDTIRGTNKTLETNFTGSQNTTTNALNSFNTNGFSFGSGSSFNSNNDTYVTRTFRKQAKFFDMQSWTGNGVNGRTILHNLGAVPGCIIIKSTTRTSDWVVYHTSLGSSVTLTLNSTAAAADYGNNITNVTSTSFDITNGSDSNANGDGYICYIYANNAGGFGSLGTDNVITCGSYTGNSGSNGPVINLGYEPQFVMIKRTASGFPRGWYMFDNMRGVPTGGSDAVLLANTGAVETTADGELITFNSTGFQVHGGVPSVNYGDLYVYVAIRRGPMRVPQGGTAVFSVSTGANATSPAYTTNFPVDTTITKGITNGTPGYMQSRLQGQNSSVNIYLDTTSAAAENTGGTSLYNTSNIGLLNGNSANRTDRIGWLFQRAPNFHDVVCFTGTSSTTTVTHNLGVMPELVIVKGRDTNGSTTDSNWCVAFNNWGGGYSGNGTGFISFLNSALAPNGYGYIGSYNATTVQFAPDTIGKNYVMYLFATCAGVSKVGTYTGTGAAQSIDCGLYSSARFVMIKRSTPASTGGWWVYDTTRGLNYSNDPYLLMNTTAAQVTGTNYVDSYATGFSLTDAAPADINGGGDTYVYLAIA